MALKIVPQPDDTAGFLMEVEALANGVASRYSPASLVIIKIDTWFGPKWLGFSGKAMGALGVWKRTAAGSAKATVPPFVPNRVVVQRRFMGPHYQEIDPGRPIHRRVPGGAAILRSLSEIAPNAAVLWYSGASANVQRGAVMAYIPTQSTYLQWYAGWEGAEMWHLATTSGISVDDLRKLIEAGHSVVAS